MRNTQLEHYHRRAAEDPLYNRKKREAYKQNPNFESVMRGIEARKWQRIKSDPERLEKERQRRSRHYAAHAEEIQEKRRQALAAMSPEDLGRKIEKARIHARKYQAQKRALRKLDPDAQQKYMEEQAEYRRRRALSRLAELSAELDRRLSSGDNDGNSEQ